MPDTDWPALLPAILRECEAAGLIDAEHRRDRGREVRYVLAPAERRASGEAEALEFEPPTMSPHRPLRLFRACRSNCRNASMWRRGNACRRGRSRGG